MNKVLQAKTMRKKRTKLLILIFLFIFFSTSVFTALLYFGIVWFNNPDRSEYPVQGIDVSHHQGEIKWEKVKKEGIDFAYIKATEGGDFIDKRFSTNWTQARKNHIVAGAYHFFTLCKSGKEQAENFISVVPIVENSLPPAIDLEFMGNCTSRSGRIDLNKELSIFMDKVQRQYKKKPVIYTTYEFYNRYNISGATDILWIRDIFMKPKKIYSWTFWQFSNRQRIEGIEGYVDGNVFIGSKEDFHLLLQNNVE